MLGKKASRTIVKSLPETSITTIRKSGSRAEHKVDAKTEQPGVVEKTEAEPAKVKKTKLVKPTKSRSDATAKAPKEAAVADDKVTKTSAPKSTKSADAAPTVSGYASSSDEDDQTAALLAGFESSEDDNDPEEDAGIPLAKLPALPDSAEIKKQLVAAQTSDDEHTPGVVYVGRIPHGFYEHQMRQYFSQFGEIKRLRLARNKLSGKPKHYAFIEFASGAVADIVAKTMDKYLMFSHILQVRRIPVEQVHPKLWKGAGTRFKAMPRNKLEGAQLKKGATRAKWDKRVQGEERKRITKAKKLQEMGYEFEMPGLKKVQDVPVRDMEKENLTITGGDDDESQAKKNEAQATPVVAEEADDNATTETTAVKRRKGTKESKKVKKARVST